MSASATMITTEDRRRALRFAALSMLPDAQVPGVASVVSELAADDLPLRYARKNLARTAALFRDIAEQSPEEAYRGYRVYVRESMIEYPDEVRRAVFDRLRRLWRAYRAADQRPDHGTWLVAIVEAGVQEHARWYLKQDEIQTGLAEADDARASGLLA